jgi:hypothetical protein
MLNLHYVTIYKNQTFYVYALFDFLLLLMKYLYYFSTSLLICKQRKSYLIAHEH